jgi:hypothetical protein
LEANRARKVEQEQGGEKQSANGYGNLGGGKKEEGNKIQVKSERRQTSWQMTANQQMKNMEETGEGGEVTPAADVKFSADNASVVHLMKELKSIQMKLDGILEQRKTERSVEQWKAWKK